MLNDEGVPLPVKIIAYPIVGLTWQRVIGAILLLDLVYGIAVALGFTHLMINLLY